jgi:excisionase family DNA binding protein
MKYKEFSKLISEMSTPDGLKDFFDGNDTYEDFRAMMLQYSYLNFKLETNADVTIKNRKKDYNNELDEYLTIEETAAVLKVTKQTIINYISKGKIKSIEFKADADKRGFTRIKKSELNRFIYESSIK